MPRAYTAEGVCTNVNNARTLCYFTAPATMVVKVVEVHVTQRGTGDAQIDCAIGRISSIGSPTVTNGTAYPHEVGDPASSVTFKFNSTGTEPTYGSQLFGLEAQPSRSGWHFTPMKPLYVAPSGTVGISLNNGMSSSNTDYDVQVVVEEIG